MGNLCRCTARREVLELCYNNFNGIFAVCCTRNIELDICNHTAASEAIFRHHDANANRTGNCSVVYNNRTAEVLSKLENVSAENIINREN